MLNTETKNQKPKTKNQKPKTKNQKPKTKNQKPKTKNQKPKTKNEKQKGKRHSLPPSVQMRERGRRRHRRNRRRLPPPPKPQPLLLHLHHRQQPPSHRPTHAPTHQSRSARVREIDERWAHGSRSRLPLFEGVGHQAVSSNRGHGGAGRRKMLPRFTPSKFPALPRL